MAMPSAAVEKMDMFPVKKTRCDSGIAGRLKSTNSVPVYCVYRLLEIEDTQYIECTKCKEWYHTDSCSYHSSCSGP